jgi:hypothetical protein
MGRAVDDPTALLLHAEVRRLKTLSGRRRAVPSCLNVGTLAGVRIVVPVAAVGTAYDAGLYADLVTRALDRLDRPADQHAWLTRRGDLAAGDQDLLWQAGAAAALARHGVLDRRFLVVTRRGWLDVGTGEARSWSRMRPSWEAPFGDDRALLPELDPFEGWPVRY